MPVMTTDQQTLSVTQGTIPWVVIQNQGSLSYNVVTIAVTGVAVQFPAVAIPEGITVFLRANANNKNEIVVGIFGVTAATGHPLVPTEGLVLNLQNTNILYANGVAGDSVRFIVEV